MDVRLLSFLIYNRKPKPQALHLFEKDGIDDYAAKSIVHQFYFKCLRAFDNDDTNECNN